MSAHIGIIIKNYCHEHHIKAPALSKLVGMDTTSIYYIYKCQHLNSRVLLKFSNALNHDFFQYFISNRFQKLKDENTRLILEIRTLKKEKENLLHENDLLKQVIKLQNP
jgi:hypothetical protein